MPVSKFLAFLSSPRNLFWRVSWFDTGVVGSSLSESGELQAFSSKQIRNSLLSGFNILEQLRKGGAFL